jgi:hypothetical protein
VWEWVLESVMRREKRRKEAERGEKGDREREGEIVSKHIFSISFVASIQNKTSFGLLKVSRPMLRMKNKLSGFVWTKVITLSNFYCIIYFLGSSISSLFFSTFTIFSISSSLSLLSLSLISLFSSIPISLHSLFFSSFSVIT